MSAVADKVDHGIITFKVTSRDLTNLKHIIEQGFSDNMKPNYSHWIYKNRSGLSDAIIWTKMDLGNMREVPLFVTDKDYNLIDVKLTKLEYPE